MGVCWSRMIYLRWGVGIDSDSVHTALSRNILVLVMHSAVPYVFLTAEGLWQQTWCEILYAHCWRVYCQRSH
jgi:hypothetical protein